MKIKLNIHLELPIKDSAFWQDIKELEAQLMDAAIQKYRESPFCGEIRCTVYSDRLEHDQEEIKSRNRQ